MEREAYWMQVPSLDVRLKDLVMVGDFAKAAGVEVSAIQSYRKKDPRFPQPWGYIGTHPVWQRKSVRAWLEGRLGPGFRSDQLHKKVDALVREMARK